MKLKIYKRKLCHPLYMGSGGKDKPNRVIDDDRLMEYVGIGWIELRKATNRDKKTYPKLVD